MNTIIDINEIKTILPHRYPFLLVDKIIEIIPKERIVGIKQITYNEPFFQGHFPDAPVMPGVLQIEALAQVGAILALREIEDRDKQNSVFYRNKQCKISSSGCSGRYFGFGSNSSTDWK